MRIINAMFGKGLGGIEQAFLDYTEALVRYNSCQVTTITHPHASINSALYQLAAECPNIEHMHLKNLGFWDVFATMRLKKFLKNHPQEAIITHGNRAFTIIKRASPTMPVIAVAHNYNLEKIVKADAVLTITKDLEKKVKEAGADRVFHIPNMIKIPGPSNERSSQIRSAPIIGVMSRFVKKKGVDVFLEALKIMKSKNVGFHAIIAGSGTEGRNLREFANENDITDNVSFLGWAEDKNAFFESNDIFCLPSTHEPFGIVILEAMSRNVPVISTNTEGPVEIIEHDKDGILVEKGNAEALAEAITGLINNKDKQKELSSNAMVKVKEKYDIVVVSKQLDEVVKEVIKSFNA